MITPLLNPQQHPSHAFNNNNTNTNDNNSMLGTHSPTATQYQQQHTTHHNYFGFDRTDF
eukprot:UN10962